MIPVPKYFSTDHTTSDGTVLQPSWGGTLVLLFGLFLTGASLGDEVPSVMARHAAVGAGASLVLLALIEIRRNWEYLLRADLVCMAALYYLLFFEFIFPQPNFDAIVEHRGNVELAIQMALCGFAAIAVGRHCVRPNLRRWWLADAQLSSSSVILVFWICFAMGYLHMLVAVNFDPIEMVWWFFAPRFDVPWGRGQFGDLAALWYELGATIYVVPPLAGIILGNRRVHKRFHVAIVLIALVFTLIYGFSTGTRSIIATYLITFLVAYFYASSRSPAEIVSLSALAGIIMLASTVYGVDFRQVGLREYLTEDQQISAQSPQDFYVDSDLYTVSELVALFPASYPYVGWEGPKWLLVRVVPRALWPSKPTGDDVSAQTYLDIPEGTTVSATFIGEAYMCAGPLGVVITGLALGIFCTWWTNKAFSNESDFGIVLYGSGFFALVTAMRSIYMLPVGFMPTLAVTALGYALVQRHTAQHAIS